MNRFVHQRRFQRDSHQTHPLGEPSHQELWMDDAIAAHHLQLAQRLQQVGYDVSDAPNAKLLHMYWYVQAGNLLLCILSTCCCTVNVQLLAG